MMFQQMVRRIAAAGKAHRWPRPLGLRRDFMEQAVHGKEREHAPRPARRALAWALAFCLMLTLLPVSALADGGEAVTVADLNALDGNVATQTVPAGTAGDEVDALCAAIDAGAVESDLAKIKLTGDGAADRDAYFENNEIKVREKAPAHIHAMSVDCSAAEEALVTFDKALTSQNGQLYIDGTAVQKTLSTYYELPAGSYYLAADVALDGCISIQGSSAPTVNLCLNGHQLAYTGGAEKENAVQIIRGELNLCDCDGSGGSHTITSRATSESVTVTGGVITGATNSAIDLFGSGCTLNLYGGVIAGNGGTSVGSGSDTVYGGGVSNKGTFVMYGGSICHNLGGYGGGVCVFGSMTLSGGKIENNRAAKAGGGIFTSTQTNSLTLSGTPVISQNVAGEEQVAASANNLRLSGRACATVGDGFATTTKIGITTEIAPATNSPVSITGANRADYSAYFTSDNPAYVIQNGPDNVVQLRIKSDDATLSALRYTVSGQTTDISGFSASTETYNVELPYGTSATAAITLTGTTNDSNASITENNGCTLSGGTGTAAATVKAEDGSTKTYTVSFTTAADTRSDAKQITAFTISGQAGETVIDQNNHTIAVTMPSGTEVTNLAPTITVSDKASVNPASGTAQDFTNPVAYTVTAENETTQAYTVTVTVQPPSGAAPTITTTTLPGGAVGTAYSQTLAATGDTPITWSVTAGSLPDGLNLNPGTGVISGTPSTAGTSTFTVKAENRAGNDTRQLSIQIDAPAPTYGISLSQTGTYTFAEAAVGYGDQTALTVTVTNAGNQPTGSLNVQIIGEGRAAFAQSTADIDSIAAGGTATFTVQPVTGLAAGIYTAAVQVSGSSISTAQFDVSFTVTEQPVTRYPLTVTGGSGSGDYAQGAQVTVNANAPAQGKRFKSWTATGMTLADATQNPVTITMPANAVTLTATYEDDTPPATSHTITFNANGGSVTPATAQTGADGKLQSLPTPTRSGSYRFDYWQLPGGTQVTLDTVYTAATIITAHWTYTGGGSSSGGGSGSGVTTTEKNPDGSTTTTVKKPGGAVTETTKAPDGTKTVVETKKDGSKTETVETPDGGKTETATTPQGDRTYTEERPDGTKISADIPKSGAATAKIDMPESARETVASFPVTDGTVVLRVLPDGSEEPIPFSLVEGGKVYVRLDADAALKVETRLGLFDDMDGHWAEKSADFIGARELFMGIAPRNFAPEQSMTRAMLTTVLYRMDGKPVTGKAAFNDVDANTWYAPGAAWAAEHDIAAGDGGSFYGERAVTRQEMAVILWRYAKYDGQDVSVGEDTNILSYTDIDKAGEWAVPALQWACGAGILQGNKDGTLNPTGSATRAEVAAILQRYVELVVQK